MGRCLGDRRSLRQNFKLSPVRRTATGRRRCFVVRIGAGAGGSRVDAMRDADVHGIGFNEDRRKYTSKRCRRRHHFRAVVALRAALCAFPAGLQTIQTP